MVVTSFPQVRYGGRGRPPPPIVSWLLKELERNRGRRDWTPPLVSFYVQGDYIGFNTRNGEKLSYSQADGLAWLCLAVA